LIEDLQDPYRRSFLIAALEEIETEERTLTKNLNRIYENIYDHLIFLFDALMVTIVNIVSKKKIKTMFPDWKRKQEQVKKPNIMTLPNGQKILIEDNN